MKQIAQSSSKNQSNVTQEETLNLANGIVSGEIKLISLELSLTIDKTLDKPNIRTVFRGNEAIAFNVIETMVARFLESFGFSNKPSPNQIEMIAVDAFEKFSYESLEDIILFFKMARSGDFGTTKRGVDSNLIFGEWFTMYLERKSIRREENHTRDKNKRNQSTTTIEDVEKTYEKAHKIDVRKKTEIEIDELIKDFDRKC